MRFNIVIIEKDGYVNKLSNYIKRQMKKSKWSKHMNLDIDWRWFVNLNKTNVATTTAHQNARQKMLHLDNKIMDNMKEKYAKEWFVNV